MCTLLGVIKEIAAEMAVIRPESPGRDLNLLMMG